jgi:alpha/beta superfamily hydrolase
MECSFNSDVEMPIGKVVLKGELVIPLEASGIVIFSHGSGSSRFSKRNQQVAKFLQERNFGTLLFDLLTVEEDMQYEKRFDIDLLTTRLVGATEWLRKFPAAKYCRIGYFGASTGAAAALKAASMLEGLKAVVSRGGRPDLVLKCLDKVLAPTLLIAGSLDTDVIKLNLQAYAQLRCVKKIEIVFGATHLFEEKGKMEEVCELSASWFEKFIYPVNTFN